MKEYWKAIEPCNHMVHLYEDEQRFLDTLENYIVHTMILQDSAFVIATKSHIVSLEERLQKRGLDVAQLRIADRLIILETEEVLGHILDNDLPDARKFEEYISKLVLRGRKRGFKVRAFSEMVAVLWKRENRAATTTLEKLWNLFCVEHGIKILCAYPTNYFTKPALQAFSRKASAVPLVLSGCLNPVSKIHFGNALAN